MALKKGFFKGLQGGVNHSPLRMHDGSTPHSKKDFKGLLAHKLATKEAVDNERLLNQSTSDNLAVEKFRQNNDVSSEKIIKNAAQVKKIEEKKIQKKQNRNRATISQGPVTEQEKKQAAINNERGEEIHNASLSLLERPLAYMSDPSALLGDMGINSFLGFDTGNTTQLARDIKTMETDPNLSTFDKLKAKTEMGLGMVPSATLNVGLGMIGAGGVGTGVKGAANYTGRVLNNAVNPLAGLGKPTVNAISNAPENFSNIVSSIGKNTDNAVTQFGRENASLYNKFTGRFKPKVKEDMYNTLESLAEGAEMSKAQRIAMIERINSPEGKKRLFNQELGLLESQLKTTEKLIENPKAHYHPWIRNQDPLNPNLDITESKLGGLLSNSKKLFKKDLSGQAKKNVEFRIQELSKPNINELAKEAIQGGKLNYSKGSDLLYNEKLPANYLNNNATFGGQIDGGISNAMKNPLGEVMLGPQQGSQVNDGVFVLGGKGTKNKATWAHETQHGGQAGRVTPLDKELLQIEPNQAIKKYEQTVKELIEARDKYSIGSKKGHSFDGFRKGQQVLDDYVETSKKFFKKNGDQLDSYKYFKTGSEGKEPLAFAGELRQSLIDGGFLKNEYDNITPHILLKAKNHFKSNPVINTAAIAPGKTANISSHRIFDFMSDSMENLTKLSSSLNKLPLSVVPIVGASTMLSQNKE